MRSPKTHRVMWMLNHTTLMPFEMKVLNSLGFEVFVPKVLPRGINSRTAEVAYEYDASLSIPQEELRTLNQINFYDDVPSKDVMKLVNRHFNVLIVPYIFPGAYYVSRQFAGLIVLRLFGHEERLNYQTCTSYVQNVDWDFDAKTGWKRRWRQAKDAFLTWRSKSRLALQNQVMLSFFELRKRLYFGAAYEPVIENEPPFFKNRSVYLPLGLPDSIMSLADTHVGGTGELAFVCPNINDLVYYRREYDKFKEHFGHLPYSIAGKQEMGGDSMPDRVNDPKILGYQSRASFDAWLQKSDCMYYHSREPRHLHYHPVEGMLVGLPVVFMGGGLLESLGGADQPGLARTDEEARAKVERVLAGDVALKQAIQQQQKKIVDKFTFDFCHRTWQENFVDGIIRKRFGHVPAGPLSIAQSRPAKSAA